MTAKSIKFLLAAVFPLLLISSGANAQKPRHTTTDEKEIPLVAAAGKLHLNLVVQEHQPSYRNPSTGGLVAPWVRISAVNQYFAFASLAKEFPQVHFTVSLTPSVIKQIKECYVDRLAPFVDLKNNTINAEAFLKANAGKTDTWLELLLKDTRRFTKQELDYLTNTSGIQEWNAFSVSPTVLSRFPEYAALLPNDMSVGQIRGTQPRATLTPRECTRLKFFFAIAQFDPDFLRKKISLPLKDASGNSVSVDMSNYFLYDDGGTPADDADDKYTLSQPIGEDDCQRLVVETYKVMASLVMLYREQMYDAKTQTGNVELAASPANNPILPLIINTDVAKTAGVISVPQFAYPQDAAASITSGVKQFAETFGKPPAGFLPMAGDVSPEMLQMLAVAKPVWCASGTSVLARSLGKSLTPAELASPYQVAGSETVLLFRDDAISDSLLQGSYKDRTAEENVQAFIGALKPYQTNTDQLLTVILGGDQDFSDFTKDNHAKRFWRLLFKQLSPPEPPPSKSKPTKNKQPVSLMPMVTCTPAEYLTGNATRGIVPHHAASLPMLSQLSSGTWVKTNFAPWIGSVEKNLAWESLAQVRRDMQAAGLVPPTPNAWPPKDQQSKDFFLYAAWQDLYEAESSDVFLLYSDNVPLTLVTKMVFDNNFISTLAEVYANLQKAGIAIPPRTFHSLLRPKDRPQLADLKQIEIDGRLNEADWTLNAGILTENAASDINRLCYGFDGQNLFLALDGGTTTFADRFAQADYKLILDIRYDDGRKYSFEISKKTMAKLSRDTEPRVAYAENTMEIQIPFALLPASKGNYQRGMALSLVLTSEQKNKPKSRLPAQDEWVLVADQSSTIDVVFEVDATAETIKDAIFITGNKPELGSMVPNKIRMWDNGKNSDRVANDRIFTKVCRFKTGETIQYKYTNSGREGDWSDCQEFSNDFRTIRVAPDNSGGKQMVVHDFYGRILK
jgi:alpha-amylase/alpha-mannosidase (GH57 family)